MLTCQKNLFKIPDGIHYLNCAYMSPQMRPVEMTGRDMLAMKNQPWLIGTQDFFQPISELKALFALLIGIRERDRVAIVPSASYGLANAAKNIRLSAGEEIVVTEGQFPSNYYIWERLCADCGGQLRVVSPPPPGQNRGKGWNEAILEAIGPKTKVVALPHVHWTDGIRFDLVRIGQRAREVGAYLIIDGTQSVGALPFDVQAIQPDALVCAGYKWLMGPYSVGLAYYGPAFDNGVPIEENWINRHNSEDFARLVDYQPGYQPLAGRYSMGEQSQFVLAPMLKTAIEQLLDWGLEEIQRYCAALLEPVVPELNAMGCTLEVPEWRGNHLLGVRLGPAIDADRLKAALGAARVMVSFRGDAVRIAPHVYNTPEDIGKLVEVFRSTSV